MQARESLLRERIRNLLINASSLSALLLLDLQHSSPMKGYCQASLRLDLLLDMKA